MIGILKFLRGYVQIKVWGFAPERFLNLCCNKEILLWDIKKEDDIFYMSISLSGFRKLRTIARKTRVRVVILKRCGLPFLLPQILKKKIFIMSFFIACLFWYWSSLHVWKISILGNRAITDDMFTDFFKDNGVYIGMNSNKLDIESLEKEIRKTFKEITWTSAKLSGTELIISVKENDGILLTEKEELPVDLYAGTEGVIVEMIVRSGVPQVKIGDTITADTLLVSGKVPVFNEDGTVREYQYTHADADIYVKRTEPVLIELPFRYINRVYTGREETQVFMKIGDKEVKIGRETAFSCYDTLMEYNRVSLLKGLDLPVHYGLFTYREYQNTDTLYTVEEAEKIFSEKYSIFLADLEEKGVQIIEKNVKIDTNSNSWVVEAEVLVHEPVGVSRETERVETGENIVDE